MAGTNPYIQTAEYTPATKTYKVTFIHDGQETTVEVDPKDVPYARSGLPGSILDICEGHNIELEHTCGGVCACSTCHVIVRQGIDSTNEQTDDELDQLEEAPGLHMYSRLGCQCVPDGSRDIVIEIPNWNRNAVKEAPHG
ncbi:MAG TPA: 2Fe-2S iron-sulfur cluster-binding protein [Armatimonadota bacterium]|jgi:2Fe-2S ferredoxin